MNILVINAGSSSLKFQLIDAETGNPIAKGLAERVGTPNTVLTFKSIDGENENKIIINKEGNHEESIARILKLLVDSEFGVISELSEIDAIGHRVVHGGEKYNGSMLIDDTVIDGVRSCNVLAPLHNPACLLGIHACRKLMPDKPEVAVFDTAFHQTMKPEQYLYPIEMELYKKHGVRKYGFHGISHAFLAESTKELIGDKEFKSIQFHLGQGSSLTAVKDGKSVDTTMGLSPLAGIIMGTRSGDIDPAIVSFLASAENIHHDDVIERLNKKSGMKALSGVSEDFRDILAAADAGNEQAEMSLRMFYNNVAQYAAKLVVTLQGAKQFVFAGGIGENAPKIRAEICKRLGFLGVELDEELNAQAIGRKMKISTANSAVEVFVIPTNEELMICKEVIRKIQ